MAWFRSREKSEAERSLESLQQGGEGEDDDAELYVTVVAAPETSAPGVRIPVLNEGDAEIAVGMPVQLVNTLSTHQTRIVSLHDEAGNAVDRFGEFDAGFVVLDDAVDLGEVCHTSALVAPDFVDHTVWELKMSVETAEQRGRDAYLTGRGTGTVKPGKNVYLMPFTGSVYAKVIAFDELPDGRVGLLLAKRDAAPIGRGDEVGRAHGAGY